MITESENAVRQQARLCVEEIKAALAEKPRRGWNEVTPPILRKYHQKVEPLGVGFVEFICFIGRMTGRYGKG